MSAQAALCTQWRLNSTRFVSLEKCCKAQLLADAAAAGRGGQTIKINEEDAAFTYKTVGSPAAGWFSAKPLFDLVHKESGGDYLG